LRTAAFQVPARELGSARRDLVQLEGRVAECHVLDCLGDFIGRTAGPGRDRLLDVNADGDKGMDAPLREPLRGGALAGQLVASAVTDVALVGGDVRCTWRILQHVCQKSSSGDAFRFANMISRI
jgi:hypothetical protein